MSDYVKLIVENGYIPPKIHISEENLRKYGNGDTFVETGTYLGETVDMVLASDIFHTIHSIELNEKLYNDLLVKYPDPGPLYLWQGDSIDHLSVIVPCIQGPATFYLDAHASGDLAGGKSGGSPVLDELDIIASSPFNDNTIIIDDCRLFGSAEWSFVKKEDAIAKIMAINPNYNIYYLDGEIPGDVLWASVK